MPPRYPVEELVALQAQAALNPDDEEAYEQYAEAFGWIDWRSSEHEVVDAFAWQLDEGDELTYREEANGTVVPIRNGVEYRVPLTRTGSDRYVMIHSLAAILKDRYATFMEAESQAGSDTHGVIVLPHAQVEELERLHPGWIGKHLSTLKGIDGFSGLEVPYYGREGAAPEFSRQRAKLDHRAERARVEFAQRIETAISGNSAAVRWNDAEQARAQRMGQWQAMGVYLVCAAAFGGLAGAGYWAMPMATAAAWLALFVGAAVYHSRVARRMKQGWRPGALLRWVPLLVLVGLVLLGLAPSLPGR